MISKAEREHINKIRQWSTDAREQLRTPIGELLKKLMPDQNPELVFDNVDWLLALMHRELHAKGVRDLLEAVDRNKT